MTRHRPTTPEHELHAYRLRDYRRAVDQGRTQQCVACPVVFPKHPRHNDGFCSSTCRELNKAKPSS